jgi:hypothetical protein
MHDSESRTHECLRRSRSFLPMLYARVRHLILRKPTLCYLTLVKLPHHLEDVSGGSAAMRYCKGAHAAFCATLVCISCIQQFSMRRARPPLNHQLR